MGSPIFQQQTGKVPQIGNDLGDLGLLQDTPATNYINRIAPPTVSSLPSAFQEALGRIVDQMATLAAERYVRELPDQ